MATKTNSTVFHLLDLDRTLLDTVALANYLKDIIAKRDVQLSHDIEQEILRHATARTSFFLFEYIANQVGETMFEAYIHELQATAPVEELLLPGALERIAFGKSQPGWSVGILTYGSRRDQMIKLKLVGLQHERHLVTNTAKKGELIASWQLPDGNYKLPIEFGGHIVNTVTLDDDKIIAFADLPGNALGQWVTHASIGGIIELPKIMTNVQPVANLHTSIEYLKTKLV
ncbi:MAG: hypothetical protein WAQ27_03320 [Candidatus Microsaccharimonas sp.]